MNCQYAEAIIQESLDRMLTVAERTGLDAHLASCVACRTLWDEYRALSGLTSAWTRQSPQSVISDSDFAAQVLSRIQSQPQRISVAKPYWGLAAASAALVVGLAVAFSTLWPTLLPATLLPSQIHPAAWLPQPQSATPALAWIVSSLRDMPNSAAQLGISLLGHAQASAQNWILIVLVTALAAKAALYFRATASRGGRVAL